MENNVTEYNCLGICLLNILMKEMKYKLIWFLKHGNYFSAFPDVCPNLQFKTLSGLRIVLYQWMLDAVKMKTKKHKKHKSERYDGICLYKLI